MRWTLGLLFVTVGLSVASARASAQCGGGGPVIGYAIGEGVTLGWEASLDPLCAGLTHASIGGAYRPAATNGVFHYIVWEPGLLLGGTLGASLDASLDPRLVVGAWTGAPIFAHPLRKQEEDGNAVPGWGVTLAIGWRWFGGAHEIYVTPKVQRLFLLDFNT